MSDDFLSRWSRRKHAAKRGEAPAPELAQAPAPPAALPAAAPDAAPAPLPPVESLTPESDFTPFMRSDVDPGLRRHALRTLFRDERFNVMDGLDVYIDDFSKPDPIPPDWLGKLNQMARLGEYKPPEAAEEPGPARGDTLPDAEKGAEDQAVASTDPVPDPPIAPAPSPPSELKHS